MGKQIRSNKVIKPADRRLNPLFAYPRDLDVEFTAQDIAEETGLENELDWAGSDHSDYGPSLGGGVPQTPTIIGVKEQRVIISDDGTATIDVVLEVEDISGVDEYEVRISKDAGNL